MTTVNTDHVGSDVALTRVLGAASDRVGIDQGALL